MAKFKFRMATLLKVRETVRDDRRAELLEAQRADDILGQRQEQFERELDALRSAYRQAAGPGTVDVDRLVTTQRYELSLKVQVQQLGRQRELLAGEIERRRQALVQANREVRVLEKLRERQTEHHAQEEDHRERKLLDEVAQLRLRPEEGP
jgi:flagellar FliJ protein